MALSILFTAGEMAISGGSTPILPRRVAAAPAGTIKLMEIAELLAPEGVVANLRAANKRQALQELAKRAAIVAGRNERAIFEVLTERERLGTTGIGGGTAIPHGRLADLPRLY